MSVANDILVSHKWDNTFKAEVKKQKDDNKNNNSGRNKKEEKSNNSQKDEEGISFNQSGKEIICFCCREKGHYSGQCLEKDNIAKKDWAVKQGLTMLLEKKAEEE